MTRFNAARRGTLAAAAVSLLSACSAPRALDLLVPRGTYRARADQAYGPHARHRLDAYLPLEASGPAPMVLFFYGGNWTRGERADYRFVGEALAHAGIVTLVADYRLSPEVRWTDILADCAAATKWAFDHAASLGAAPDRIHVMGHSAGGYNAAMLALDPRWLKSHALAPEQLRGWIGLAGPYNFLPIQDPEVRVAFDWPGTPPESQPIVHASARAPHSLLIAAASDKVVNPQRNTVTLAERLEKLGAKVDVRLLDRVNHVTLMAALSAPLHWLAPVRREIIDFVSRA
ncbi:MAG: alpha/beta hydrolase [Pseudomonadota bacterium]